MTLATAPSGTDRRSDSERRRDALKFLAIARRVEPDSAVALVYQQALADLDPEWLEAACHELAQRARLPFEPALPDVGTVRAIALDLRTRSQEQARRRALPAAPSDSTEPTFFCLLCLDETSGLRVFWCPGIGPSRTFERPPRATGATVECGKPRDHQPHSYAMRCECWRQNPVVDERRQRQFVKRTREHRDDRRGD